MTTSLLKASPLASRSSCYHWLDANNGDADATRHLRSFIDCVYLHMMAQTMGAKAAYATEDSLVQEALGAQIEGEQQWLEVEVEALAADLPRLSWEDVYHFCSESEDCCRNQRDWLNRSADYLSRIDINHLASADYIAPNLATAVLGLATGAMATSAAFIHCSPEGVKEMAGAYTVGAGVAKFFWDACSAAIRERYRLLVVKKKYYGLLGGSMVP